MNGQEKLITLEKSIIVACDFRTTVKLGEVVSETCDHPSVSAYKIGFMLGLGFGLQHIVRVIRGYTMKPIIYDHQKAGTDVPHTAKGYAAVCAEAGVNAVIIFPLSGPVTAKEWIQQCLDTGMHVIVGGSMTHDGFSRSQGGYLDENDSMRIYEDAYNMGVSDFVVPGNKPETIQFLREKYPSVAFYSPGLVAQGGKISDAAVAAGNNWHAIVGRAVMDAKDRAEAVNDLAKGFDGEQQQKTVVE